MMWVMSKIDNKKLLNRIRYAHFNPSVTTKCVLLEYSYTSRAYENQGNPNIVECMPESKVLVHHALHTPDFIWLMDTLFKNNNPKIQIYARQKIKSDGTPDFHRKQLVVAFEPWTFVPQPVEENVPMDTIE